MARKLSDLNLNLAQRAAVVAMIARGDDDAKIINLMQLNYRLPLDSATLAIIRKGNATQVAALRREIRKASQVDTAKILGKVDLLLVRKLTRVLHDLTESEALDKKMIAGTLNVEDYIKQKSVLVDMSVNDILKIRNELKTNIPNEPQAPKMITAPTDRPVDESQVVDPEKLRALSEAIDSNDPIRLQALVYPTIDK